MKEAVDYRSPGKRREQGASAYRLIVESLSIMCTIRNSSRPEIEENGTVWFMVAPYTSATHLRLRLPKQNRNFRLRLFVDHASDGTATWSSLLPFVCAQLLACMPPIAITRITSGTLAIAFKIAASGVPRLVPSLVRNTHRLLDCFQRLKNVRFELIDVWFSFRVLFQQSHCKEIGVRTSIV